ncbi:GNAT family N-acetyltransferase [Paracoccus sp. p4-l81]|uniref:GNAT family N-acetyltransferase n=1 Tax=Paracoccus sp. p4-l81 TaxID=3342806 RepID=UPI0035B7144A
MTTLTAHIPVIETERLRLRGPCMADLPAFAAFGRSDRSHFVGGPSTADHAAWDGLRGMIGHWVLRGFGWWTVEDKATGTVAGRVGIGHHTDWPEPELGWHIFDGFEGKGLAHEAALAARAHAHGPMRLGPVISLVHPDNLRSRRLAERMGARIEGDMTLRGTPCLIYRHPAGAA